MTKRKSIIDVVRNLPAEEKRTNVWHVKLMRQNPKLHDEICGLVDAFYRRDPRVCEKLPTKTRLKEFLVSWLVEHGMHRSLSSMQEFVNGREPQ